MVRAINAGGRRISEKKLAAKMAASAINGAKYQHGVIRAWRRRQRRNVRSGIGGLAKRNETWRRLKHESIETRRRGGD